jgi:hypothetical protein
MVIFDAMRLNPEWTKGEFPGTTYGLSDNGWINSELFEAWMSEHFLKHAVSARPLLLVLDGHSTHYQPQVLRLAKENDVVMLCLPPHTTNEAQPLDCGVLALSKLTGRVCAMLIYSKIQVVSSLASNSVHCSHRRGVLQCHLPT